MLLGILRIVFPSSKNGIMISIKNKAWGDYKMMFAFLMRQIDGNTI